MIGALGSEVFRANTWDTAAMEDVDATTVADLAIRVGLLTPVQVRDAWDEVGEQGGEPEPLLRALERKGYLTPWQSAKLLKGDDDGYFLGGYRLLYKIASGSFGRVFRPRAIAHSTSIPTPSRSSVWKGSAAKIAAFA